MRESLIFLHKHFVLENRHNQVFSGLKINNIHIALWFKMMTEQ